MYNKAFPQYLFGGTILFLGVGFLLDALGVWDFSSIVGNWWPIFIVLIGILSLLANPHLPVWPSFIIATGLLLLLKTLDIVHFSVWQVIWPVALIMLGIAFFVRQITPYPREIKDNSSDLFVAFSGVESVSKSAHYLGGKLSALFGGINLDLRQANIDNRARLDIFTAFGGIDLKVPEDWTVNVRGLPIFGGWEDKTKKPAHDDGKHVLDITGTCLFGGVSIKN